MNLNFKQDSLTQYDIKVVTQRLKCGLQGLKYSFGCMQHIYGYIIPVLAVEGIGDIAAVGVVVIDVLIVAVVTVAVVTVAVVIVVVDAAVVTIDGEGADETGESASVN